ncbi:MAG: transposase domain-containing protein [Polyangiaceae bacterium]|nr:transposase domain-containing protein [Polyangiaceae bacterium]
MLEEATLDEPASCPSAESLSTFEKHISPAWIDEALEATGTATRYRRRLGKMPKMRADELLRRPAAGSCQERRPPPSSLSLPLSPFERNDVACTRQSACFKLLGELRDDIPSTGLRGEHERLFERGDGSMCV